MGQEPITRTLQNALTAGRVAHAFLFSGPRGVGKTSVARILAKALNCEAGPTPHPDNTCQLCQAITNGSSLDVLEIDGASNRGIDEVRDLREKIKYLPTQGKYKVYIIDEVHMLTKEAFNALLKTLEEPPAHAVFILATTEPHKVPVTILSRCQRYDFRRIPTGVIQAHLANLAQQEGWNIDPEGLALVARAAEGGLRDAQGFLDQVVTFGGDGVSVPEIARITPASEMAYARLIAGIERERGLRSITRDAVARLVESSARHAGDAGKLSTNHRFLNDLLREADYFAGERGAALVERNDVQRALDAQTHRHDRIRERVHESIVQGTVLIDTSGVNIGQVNGLSVISLGDFSFGTPTRITATARVGDGKVVDIEREVDLGGAIHSKGVLILSSYFAARYSRQFPLSLSASLVFEQSYAGVEA